MKLDLSKITNNKDITNLEYQVLEYIINNIHNVMKLGVRGVAKENYTSTSTIMRLAKKLGYEGFIDMVYNIMPMVDNEEKILSDDMISMDGIDIKNLLKYISEKEIDIFLENLININNKFIFIYATGLSKIIGEYLSKKLLILGKKNIFSSGSDSVGVFENHLQDMGLLFVISKSGETKTVLDKVNSAKEKHIKVVSITGDTENSVSKASDINFKIFDMNKLDDRNYYPNTFFPNCCMLIEYIIFRYLRQINKE